MQNATNEGKAFTTKPADNVLETLKKVQTTEFVNGQPMSSVSSSSPLPLTMDGKQSKTQSNGLFYTSITLWACISVIIALTSGIFSLPALQIIQFFSLMALPAFMASIILMINRRHQNMMQHMNNMQYAQLPSLEKIARMNPEISSNMLEQQQLLNQTNEETHKNLHHMIVMVDERIAAMRSVSATTQTEFKNITEHMNLSLRDSLTQITGTTEESMGQLKNIIDIVKEREGNIHQLNQNLMVLEKDISGILDKRQTEIHSQIEKQLATMLDSFQKVKEDMVIYKDDMFSDVMQKNDENRQKIEELISGVTGTIHKRQEDLLGDFESANNGMYQRVQKILHELGTHNDQLVNRVEARQVQIRDLLERNNGHFTNLFQQYNLQYDDMCDKVIVALQEKGVELTQQIKGGLNEFTDTLGIIDQKRVENEHRLTEFVQAQSGKIYDDLKHHHQHNYQKISEYFNSHQNWMQNLTDTLQGSFGDFKKHAHDYRGIFEETIGSASQNTKTLGKNIRDELEQVINSVNLATDNVRQVTGNFNEACEKLDGTHSKSEQILDKVDKSLVQHAHTLIENTERLEGCSKIIEGNFSKHAHKVTQLTTYVKENQEKTFGELITNINQRIEFMQDNVQRHSGMVTRSINESIAKQTETMSLAMQKNIQRIDHSGVNLSEVLAKSCNDAIIKFNAQGKRLEDNVIQLLQKLLKSTQVLDQGIDKIDGSINNTDNKIASIKEITQKQTVFFDALLERIEKNSGGLRQKIQQDQEQLVRAIHAAEEKATRSKETMLENSEFFIEKTDDISTRFHSIHEKMNQHLRIISDVSTQAQSHCVQMDEKLRGQVNGLQSAITSHNASLSSAFSPAMEQLVSVSNIIQERADGFYQMFNNSLDKVETASDNLTSKGENIISVLDYAETSINNSSTKLGTTAEQMDVLAKNIEQQAHKMENSVQYQIREIDQCAHDFETRIHNMNGALTRYIDTIKNNGDNMTNNFTDNSMKFQKTAESIQLLFTDAMSGLSKNSGEFENQLRRLLTSLQQTGTLIQNHSNQLQITDKKMNDFSDNANQTVEQVMQKLNILRESFDDVTERMNKNIIKLSSTVADKKSGVLSVTDHVQDVQEKLVLQCREALDITNQARQIMKNIPHMTSILQAQTQPEMAPSLPQPQQEIATSSKEGIIAAETNNMQQTAEATTAAPATTYKAEQPSADAVKMVIAPKVGLPQRDSQLASPPVTGAPAPNDPKYINFMNSARKLIEELHLTSHEICKTINSRKEIARMEKEMKTGKQNAFTIYLLNNNTPEFIVQFASQQNKNQQTKHLSENYQNKFESLINSSKDFSADNRLTDNFVNSDIGKLYMMLAQISGRTAIHLQ